MVLLAAVVPEVASGHPWDRQDCVRMCPFCAQGVNLALKMKELVHGFNIINKCIHVLCIYIYT